MDKKDHNLEVETDHENVNFGKFGQALVMKKQKPDWTPRETSSSPYVENITYAKAILGSVAVYTTSRAFEIRSASALP